LIDFSDLKVIDRPLSLKVAASQRIPNFSFFAAPIKRAAMFTASPMMQYLTQQEVS
jgi:hypothetical protein